MMYRKIHPRLFGFVLCRKCRDRALSGLAGFAVTAAILSSF